MTKNKRQLVMEKKNIVIQESRRNQSEQREVKY